MKALDHRVGGRQSSMGGEKCGCFLEEVAGGLEDDGGKELLING